MDPIEDENPECPEPFCCHQHLPVVTEDGELSFVINSYWPALSKSETIKYPIIYKLRKYKDGSHKIVNIIINGINLGQTFHNQFQSLALEFDNDIDLIILKWQSDFFADG